MAGIDNISTISFIDYDNDGDKDLFVGRWGADVALQNRLVEDGTANFVDVTAALNWDTGDQRTMGFGWGDYDRDGDLDVYLIRHSHCGLGPAEERKAADLLFRNDGTSFAEVTNLLDGAGEQVAGLGFSVAWVDYDLDGDDDLFVANDHISDLVSRPNVLWRNDGPDPNNPSGWLFVDVSESSKFGLPFDGDVDDVRDARNAMGISFGDINYDGRPDLTFTNIGPNFFMVNNPDGTFTDMAEAWGLQRTDLPWGLPSITWATQLLDFDNDGDLDVFYSGGRIDVLNPYPNAMFRNDGLDQPWADVTYASGLADMESGRARLYWTWTRTDFPNLS